MLQIARFGAIAICDSNRESQITSDFNRVGIAILLRFEKGFKSQIALFELRFEAFLTAVWGIFLRFGLCDLKSLAIRDL